jgi:hypothetical protein
VTFTICADHRIDLVGADRFASSAGRGIEDLVKRGSIGLRNEVLEQVLLQRLVRSGRALSQYRMCPLGNSSNSECLSCTTLHLLFGL